MQILLSSKKAKRQHEFDSRQKNLYKSMIPVDAQFLKNHVQYARIKT